MVQLLNEVHGRTVRYVPADENICVTVFGSSDAPTMPPLPEPWMARGDPWVPDGTSSVRRLPSDAARARPSSAVIKLSCDSLDSPGRLLDSGT